MDSSHAISGQEHRSPCHSDHCLACFVRRRRRYDATLQPHCADRSSKLRFSQLMFDPGSLFYLSVVVFDGVWDTPGREAFALAGR